MQARKLDDFIEMIKNALNKSGRYSTALDLQIYSLASTLIVLDLANREIQTIDSAVLETARSIIPHPVFRIQRDAVEQVTRQMKALSLTAEDLPQDMTSPVVNITEQLIKVSEVKPLAPVKCKKKKSKN